MQTWFKTIWNETVVIPNFQLSAYTIYNLKRSPVAWLEIRLELALDTTTPEKLVQLERAVHNYVQHMSRDWKRNELWFQVYDQNIVRRSARHSPGPALPDPTPPSAARRPTTSPSSASGSHTPCRTSTPR